MQSAPGTVRSSTHVIGANTRVKGGVSGSGSLVVAGHIQGTIHLDGDLTIARGAVAEAGLEATDVVVEGEVRGDITGTRTIQIGAGARVVGNLSAPQIAVDPGACVTGRFTMALDLPAGIQRGRPTSNRW